MGELENDGLNIKNFYRMICFCLNTDILVDHKLKYYNNIMDSVKLNDYDELTEDIFTIGNYLNIIMDLDAFQIQVLKLVYQNIGRIDGDLISREIKKSKLNGMNKNDIKIIIRKLYINRDIGITSENFHKYYVVMCLLVRKGYLTYRSEMFGMLNSHETCILSNLPKVEEYYQREMYLLFSENNVR